MSPLALYLTVSAVLFALGFGGALTRRNSINVLIGIELMLNAANLNFIAFWRYATPSSESLTGILFVLFSIAIAAAEAAVGLALIIHVQRRLRTVNVDELTTLRDNNGT